MNSFSACCSRYQHTHTHAHTHTHTPGNTVLLQSHSSMRETPRCKEHRPAPSHQPLVPASRWQHMAIFHFLFRSIRKSVNLMCARYTKTNILSQSREEIRRPCPILPVTACNCRVACVPQFGTWRYELCVADVIIDRRLQFILRSRLIATSDLWL